MSEKDSKKPLMNQTDSKKELLKEQETEQVAGGIRFRKKVPKYPSKSPGPLT